MLAARSTAQPHSLIPRRTVADNRQSTVLLACVKCGQKYQAVSGQVRTCKCGGELKPVKKQEGPKS